MRPAAYWTADRLAALAEDYQTMHHADLAIRYGRDWKTLYGALRRYGYTPRRLRDAANRNRSQGMQAANRAYRQGHYSPVDMGALFSIRPETALNWFRSGWIEAHAMPAGRGVRYAFTREAIERFLMKRGGLFDLRVAEPFTAIYQRARERLRGRYIQGPQIQRLMMVSTELRALQRAGLPAPTFRLGSAGGGDWYEIAAVRRWLDAHPHRHTADTRRVLG